MVDFVTLSCPTCNAKLEITKEINRFACAHCGNEHVVVRKGGMVSLNPVEESIGRIEKSTDKMAAELAIKRLSEEIKNLEYDLDKIFHGESFYIHKNEESLYFAYMELQKKMGLGSFFKRTEDKNSMMKKLTSDEMLEVVDYIRGKYPGNEYYQSIIKLGERFAFLKKEILQKKESLKENRKIVD